MAEQNFSAALATWKAEIGLSELQRNLDTTASELVENQKENLVGRKKLADQTREFKKLPDEPEKFNSIKTLLKAYQSEIDALTRRSKLSETSFLNLYKLLADAPDPYPLLDAAVDQTVKVAEARMMATELGRLREENADLKKRAEEGRGVEDRLKKAEKRADGLEKEMEDMISERVLAKQNELNAEYDERLRNYDEREKDLQRQVQMHKTQLRDMHTSAETTEARLLDASHRQEQDVHSRLAELDMVAADLTRANERVAVVERRNELLRAEIESVRSGSQQAERVKTLESQITDLESEASRLLRALDSAKEAKSDVERTEKKRADEAAKELAVQAAEIEHLRTRVKEFADYDEIKRELEIMKYVEFSGADLDEEPSLPSPLHTSSGSGKQGQSLENLLVSKNRRLLDDLTKLRVAFEEVSTAHSRSEEYAEGLREKAERMKELNERLEGDLIRVNGGGAAEGGAGRGEKGLAGLDLGRSTVSPGNTDNSPAPAAGPDTSILPIVTSQRDRFRQRNAELEEELRKQFETVTDLRTEIKSLQTDNLKLYEKVRYVNAYRDAPNSVAGPSGLLGGVMGRRDEEIGRYKDKYEESMNPFEAFKGREAQRALQALNPMDKAVFALTRAIIGNKRARSFFVFYTAALHLLILFVLWGTMAASDSGHAAIPIKPIG
ncbi:CASP C terminal-domain-containing protein [Dioszegia hungarica]|uniref:Protein CASP n=1 Tax=Dioszegia hungarica TaxID=4972 RepID=A0AA38H530_9TREE|nr:CASP C terminal-domain-containing protein [Dioszegia hungarica]KAI9633995.1 CASP C terminal-domain-containing protein [Dioszegia hungarica]